MFSGNLKRRGRERVNGHILFIYYVTVYMCIITISNTGIFCYSFLVVVLLMIKNRYNLFIQ